MLSYCFVLCHVGSDYCIHILHSERFGFLVEIDTGLNWIAFLLDFRLRAEAISDYFPVHRENIAGLSIIISLSCSGDIREQCNV